MEKEYFCAQLPLLPMLPLPRHGSMVKYLTVPSYLRTTLPLAVQIALDVLAEASC